MITTYTYSTTLTVISCGNCGIGFAIPKDYHTRALEIGVAFWCPNGHNISYSTTTNQRLTNELEHANKDRQWYANRWHEERKESDHQRRRAAAARGHLTRIKNRIANGVCPVPGCKRSGLGADVVAHIASCHPQYHLEATP